MSFIFFAWIASVSFGLVGIIGKLTSKYAISNAWLFNFLWTLFYLVFITPFAISNNVGIPTNWGTLILASLFNSIFSITYILGLSFFDVSVFIPLLNLGVAFTVILSGIILNEILTPIQYILIFIIFMAGMFVGMDEKYSIRSFLKWPIAIVLLSALSLSLMSVFIKKSIAENGYWSVTIWMGILSQIMLLTTVPFFRKNIKRISLKQIGFVIVMSLVLVVGNLCSNRAYAENVSISRAIEALPFSMIMALLFSIFAPKLLEKHTLKVYAIRFTAAAIMIAAALKISL